MKSKEQKRKEAIERNVKWSKLSPKEKIKDLDRRNMKATKQRRKINPTIIEGE